ncbi:hypothetical protein CYG48_07640 [Neorhizobium sp. SOG26]|uniref:hypothetical protein n=1 Tax=Neorhizobium sp. SOG26 TaxID=2060726 RepID=UPI000E58CD39|nr:hypothetical protein [Neorhizobium sp. SOG26]AXV15579.1 hypothetical protein CYG48_07640 [Neorhizobium sp. SOG26]
MRDDRITGELVFDIQTGLGRTDIPEYDLLRMVGMGAVLAAHIKSFPDIPYEKLRLVSEHYFNIPSYALKGVVELLAEVELVKIDRTGTTINKITPNISVFDNVYLSIGEYSSIKGFNELENVALEILFRLRNKPENLISLGGTLGIDPTPLSRTISIGEKGNFVRKYRARGKDIILSPIYFADGLDALADLAASKGLSDFETVMRKLKSAQGWPLDLLLANSKLAGVDVSREERDLILKLVQENVIKPPSLSTPSGDLRFLFTPAPGQGRLNATNRLIYERAMNLVSAVRKGQLLPARIRIRSPYAILRSLRDTGYLRPSTEAHLQYGTLVSLKVAVLEETTPGWHRLRLVQTQENIEAINMALAMLRTGDPGSIEIDRDAVIALESDESYVESVVSAAQFRERSTHVLDPEATKIFNNLLLESD